MNPCADLVDEALKDPETSWAIGTFGAIAEFHRDAEEPVTLSPEGAITPRGGIRLSADVPARVIAWERPTASDGWTQGIALCLDAQTGGMHRRHAITELGEDDQALDGAGRREVLFDLGLGAPHCDVCVRTDDPELLGLLRRNAERSALHDGLLAQIARF